MLSELLNAQHYDDSKFTAKPEPTKLSNAGFVRNRFQATIASKIAHLNGSMQPVNQTEIQLSREGFFIGDPIWSEYL